MKVLFLLPPLSFTDRKIFPMAVPHYSTYTAAALEMDGVQVRMIDAFLDHLDLETIVEQCKRENPDVVAIVPDDYTRETPRQGSLEIARALGRILPEAVIGLAGTTDMEQDKRDIASIPELGFAAYGEYDLSIPGLVRNLKGDWSGIPGLTFRGKGGEAVNSGTYEPVSNLDAMPFPAWRLIDMERYTFIPHRHKFAPFYPLLCCRGCPFNCKCCENFAYSKIVRYRLRSVENVMAEFAMAVKRFGAREIQFADPTFGVKRPWVFRLCDAIEQSGFGVPWSVISRVNVLDKEMLQRMAETGCWNVLYGVESANPELLDRINKRISLDRVVEFQKEARSLGLKTTASFMFGLPGETPDDADETIRFAIKLNPDFAQFGLFKFSDPNSEFSELGTPTKEWDMAPFDFRGRVFIPNAYSGLEELKAKQRQAYRRFYLRPRKIAQYLPELLNPAHWRRYLWGGYIALRTSLSKET